MKLFLINEATPFEIRAELAKYGRCVPLPALEALDYPVCRHPDMLMATMDGTVFVHREYEKGQEILRRLGIPFLISETEVGKVYPRDVSLNCFTVGKYLFAKPDSVSRELLAKAEEKGKTLIPVSQGYAKCSTAVAGGAIASADKGIVRAAEKVGIPALLLPSHKIGIEVYDTGFIGGASVTLDEKTLGFFGNIEEYPSFAELKSFFSTVGVEIVSLSKKPLFDFGGAIMWDDTL